MDADEVAYRKSVRNMSLVLAAIVIVVFASIFIPPYVFPPRSTFQDSASLDSPFGFTLHLLINTTSPSPRGHVLITGWLNSTSDSIETVNASNSWIQGSEKLWTKPCTSGWPIGLGVMQGHYTQDNYTLGALLPLPHPLYYCPAQVGAPSYFLLEPHSSKALVDIGGSPQYWVIETSYTFGYTLGEGLSGGSGPNQLPTGVYTVVLTDEWGDVLTTNFLVS